MITTTRYDVAEHLRTPEEMAMYLDACIEESGGDATFIAKVSVFEKTPLDQAFAGGGQLSEQTDFSNQLNLFDF